MSPYRKSARPKLIVGDRVRVSFTWWERMKHRSDVSSWNGHEATVRSLFVYKCDCAVAIAHGLVCGRTGMSCRFGGEHGAGLDLDEGGGITMPLRFLVRPSAPKKLRRDSPFPISYLM